MSRHARQSVAGGVYHVTTHGNGAAMVFDQPYQKLRVLDLVAETAESLDWDLYAWCIMGNHYHLLVRTPENDLSQGMHQINMKYGEWLNRTLGVKGHVFQDRFYSILLTQDSHLLEASRYIVLNPVRAGLVSSPEEWPWSSYGPAVTGAPSRVSLHDQPLMAMFDEASGPARAAYQEFVKAGIGLDKPLFLMSGKARTWAEATRAKETGISDGLDRSRNMTPDPAEVARVLELHGEGLSLRSIAEAMGLSHTTVRRYLALAADGDGKPL